MPGWCRSWLLPGSEYQINEDIKDGGLNKYLIRPVNYCGYRFCSYLGEKMPQLILLLICTSVLVAFSSIFLGLKLSLVRIVLFLVGLVLAVILNFFIFYCVALLSFWLTDVHLLFGTVSVVLVVVSGGVFPMDIFGKTAALLISLLPFEYTTQFPVNIINGKLSMGAIGTGMLCQLAWIAFFLGTGADDVEKRTAALCSGRRLTDEKKTGILNTFIRYGKLLFVFLKMSLMAQLEYRINFAAGVLVETGWLLIKLLYVAVVYRAGIKIGVLTPDHILLFIGVYILLTGVYMLYYPNFTSLTTMIRDGKLDMYLVKPVAAQFLVTMQRLDLSLLVPDAAAGIVMIGIGWHRAGLPVTVGSIAGFCLFS